MTTVLRETSKCVRMKLATNLKVMSTSLITIRGDDKDGNRTTGDGDNVKTI